jgi:hypothetical protein
MRVCCGHSLTILRVDSSSVVNGSFNFSGALGDILLLADCAEAEGYKSITNLYTVRFCRNSTTRRQRGVVVCSLVPTRGTSSQIGGACAEGTHYFHNGDGVTAVLWFVLMSL